MACWRITSESGAALGVYAGETREDAVRALNEYTGEPNLDRDDGLIVEPAEGGAVRIPEHLAEPLHRYHYGQGCPIYAAGSMAAARRDCPVALVEACLEAVEGVHETTLDRYELCLATGAPGARELGDDASTLEMLMRGLRGALQRSGTPPA